MKKALLIIAAICGLVAQASAYDFSVVVPSGQTLYFNIVGGNAQVTCPASGYPFWNGYTLPTGDLTIPASVTYQGTTYPVTSFGEHALEGCNGLTSLTIPNSVTAIDDQGVWRCSGLTSLTLPNSLTFIGERAFLGCTGLTTLTIPSSVTTIESHAFRDCTGLQTIYYNATNCTFPWWEGSSVFDGCDSISTVIVGDNVTHIPSNFMVYRYLLPSVTIGSSVNYIGEKAFYFCQNLTEVHMRGATPPSLHANQDMFYVTPANKRLYVPCGALGAYANWLTSDFAAANRHEDLPYALTLLSDGNGTATYTFDCATSVATLTATPNTGYHFSHWSENSTANPRTLTLTANTTLTAYFAADIYYTITVNPYPAHAGTTTGSGTYSAGTTVTLTATPAEGYHFSHWNDGGSLDNPRTVIVDHDATYNAIFEADPADFYTLTTSVLPMDGGTVTGGGTYPTGSTATLTAIPNPGYRFHSWWPFGTTDNPLTWTVTEDLSIIAQFIRDTTSTEPGGEPDGPCWHSNIFADDSGSEDWIQWPDYGIYHYAERFINKGPLILDSVSFTLLSVSSQLPETSTLTLSVYLEENTFPASAPILTQTITYADLRAGVNLVALDEPLAIDGNFFIGLYLGDHPGDTVLMLSTGPRQGIDSPHPFFNSAYAYYNGYWCLISNLFNDDEGNRFYTSLAVRAHGCPNPQPCLYTCNLQPGELYNVYLVSNHANYPRYAYAEYFDRGTFTIDSLWFLPYRLNAPNGISMQIYSGEPHNLGDTLLSLPLSLPVLSWQPVVVPLPEPLTVNGGFYVALSIDPTLTTDTLSLLTTAYRQYESDITSFDFGYGDAEEPSWYESYLSFPIGVHGCVSSVDVSFECGEGGAILSMDDEPLCGLTRQEPAHSAPTYRFVPDEGNRLDAIYLDGQLHFINDPASPDGCLHGPVALAIPLDSDPLTIRATFAPDNTEGIATAGDGAAPRLYPNPATTSVTIEGYEGEVQVIDLTGRTVLRSTETTLDLSSLPAGTYFVKLGNAVQKLIVK